MLKAIQLGQQLTKKEMKEIKGGGTCCAHSASDAGEFGTVECGLSKKDAQKLADQIAFTEGSGYWCCASCANVL